jgi:hypothetical protein
LKDYHHYGHEPENHTRDRIAGLGIADLGIAGLGIADIGHREIFPIILRGR